MLDALRLPPFGVSDTAIEQLTSVGGLVRVDLVAGGCSGRTWTFSTGPARSGDQLYGCAGALLAVSSDAHELLVGARLDYGARLSPPRFRVLGTAADTCPCRRSLGAPWPGRGQPACQARVPMPWDRR